MKIHNRREFLRGSGCAVAAALLAGCSSPGRVGRSTGRPNIVFILADNLGYGDIGCYGSETIRTPNIDRMAREGMKFTDFYVNAPVGSPVRAEFLTGRAQQRCGAETVFTPGRMDAGLALNETTLAEHLRDGGYTTGIFGKWHLGYSTDLIGADSIEFVKANKDRPFFLFVSDLPVARPDPVAARRAVRRHRFKPPASKRQTLARSPSPMAL